LALDLQLDRLIAERHRGLGNHEVDIEAIHADAIRQLLGRDLAPQLSARLEVALQRAWVEGAAPVEPALEALRRLREQDVRIGLCSNAPYPPALMYEQLERLDLRRYFDAVLFSSEIGWRKPDPRIFAEVLARMALPVTSVWFVGDDWEADIKGAQQAGMRALLAPGATAPEESAERLQRWEDLQDFLG
jgi:HAD superfamily hydrolase (TIGR01549 family)